MLISREKEKQVLLDALKAKESQFIAVYGRRRVGKTYLIRQTYGDLFTFEHSGLANGDRKEQIQAFTASIRRAGLSVKAEPKNWLDAFELLKDLIQTSNSKKKIIFIDELSWMDTQKGSLLVALENFWNGWASARDDVVFVVCASATSWMLDKIVHNKGGLYNRLTAQIYLKPFRLIECEEYLKARNIDLSRYDILELYMAVGGIPFYWNYVKKGYSVAQNIDAMFFAEGAPMKDEFKYLYASLFKNPEAYIQVITILGRKKAGMSREELIEEGMDDNGKLTKILVELEYCGFIRKYNCIGFKKKNAVFQLIDPYTLFYFRFIAENVRADKHFWSTNQNSPLYYNWCGLAFERVCFAHEEQILQALGISGVSTVFFAWRTARSKTSESGAQIDLVIDRADGVINLCEIKFTKEPFTVNADDEEDLENKMARFSEETHTDKAIHLVLISAKGLKKNEYSNIFQNIITLENLFKS